MRRALFFALGLALLLGVGEGEGETLGEEFARDVRILGPARARDGQAPGTGPEKGMSGDHVLPGTGRNPVGRGLLAFFGCVTCHDLGMAPAERRGPDLDRIGEKTPGSWLRRWLEDPSAALPGAKMPRVPMSEGEREALVSFLLARSSERGVPAAGGGDAESGKTLFDAYECTACHRMGGDGEDVGPALDRVGARMRRSWLVAFLMRPGEMSPGTEMRDFGFSQDQAEDLAAYLIEEAGGGEKGEASEKSDSASVRAGLSAFARKGCAGCHRVGAYRLPLSRPAPGAASDFVAYHATGRGRGPRVALREARAEAMAEELRSEGGGGRAVDAEAFLEAYWETPIPLQGWAPAAYDSAAAGLHPEACGTCHAAQWEDWRTTVHSLGMGPGVMGQLVHRIGGDPEFVVGCQYCHAPASEQHPVLPTGDGGYESNYRYDAGLQKAGITCVVCHVRGHVRFGPPPGTRPAAQVWRGPGHGGAVAAPAFESAAFCRGCHQFEAGDTALNGKLLQDTYAEWREGPHAAAGKTCQMCHMPDRRHLWRGIHDPEMVRQAVELQVAPVERRSDSLVVEVRLANVGAGHHLPTYVTPKLFVDVRLLDGGLRPLEGTDARRSIGREVVLTSAERREVFDTRIPAGGRWTWRYAAERRPEAHALEVDVWVHPDHLYLRFFESYSRAGLGREARAMIDSAEANARRSPYRLLRKQWPLVDF